MNSFVTRASRPADGTFSGPDLLRTALLMAALLFSPSLIVAQDETPAAVKPAVIPPGINGYKTVIPAP
ncbi:MAG TPA: hypothetical protein VIO38_06105, partial [Rariglobus sp.]